MLGVAFGQPEHSLRLSDGGEPEPGAAAPNGLQKAGAVLRHDEKGGVGGTLLQQLEHGVLGVDVHGLVDEVDLPGGLVGGDLSVGPDVTDGRDLDLLLPLALRQEGGEVHHVGVDALPDLAAVGAAPAGNALPGAEVRLHEEPCQGVAAGPLGTAENDGVGRTGLGF